jgi:hypothetical protein
MQFRSPLHIPRELGRAGRPNVVDFKVGQIEGPYDANAVGKRQSVQRAVEPTHFFSADLVIVYMDYLVEVARGHVSVVYLQWWYAQQTSLFIHGDKHVRSDCGWKTTPLQEPTSVLKVSY